MEEIIALEKRRIEAMTNQDANALGEILADDLSYTHSSGRVESKAEPSSLPMLRPVAVGTVP